MTDRELLELAAKAVGTYVEMWGEDAGPTAWVPEDLDMNTAGPFMPWNPLTDDGDALRLAVKLRLKITPPSIDSAVVHRHDLEGGRRLARVVSDGDHDAATRRAIVRAAAEIGRTMP